MKYSVIIPTFNAANHIQQCIDALRRFSQDAEIIVSDGGSSDDTINILRKNNITYISSLKGRGIQLNEGRKKASGEILFFLHADTIVSSEVFPQIKQLFRYRDVQLAKCRLSFDKKNKLLCFYALLARIDSLWTSFGDQGIIVRSEFFDQIGGFPNFKLLEDVDFLQKARKITKIHTLNAEVITSAERFVRNGFIVQQIFNTKIIFKYLLGISHEKLAREYEDLRRRK